MTIRRSSEEVHDADADHGRLEHDQRRRVTTVEEEPVGRVARRDAELTGEEEVTSSSHGGASIPRRLMGTLPEDHTAPTVEPKTAAISG